MRVLFTTWNSPSHFFPMVPLGWALMAAGHEVRVAAPPGCAASVNGAGLTFVPVGPDIDVPRTSTGGELKAWHQQRGWPGDWPVRTDLLDEGQLRILRALGEKQFAIAEGMLPDLLDHARAWRPDLVVHDAGSYAGTVVASALGIPAVSHMWGSAAVLRLEREDLHGEPLPGYTKLFASAGADPDRDPAFWIDPCPPSLRLPSPVERFDLGFVPYNGPGQVPALLADPSPRDRVCITWGVTAGRLDPESALPVPLRDLAAGIAARGTEVVLAVTAAQQEHLTGLPDGIRVVAGLPLGLLLPTCRAVVHQGGGGTAMTATLHGVPQLVLAPRPEQMLTGHRLAAVGAGRHLPLGELGGPDASERLLTEAAALLDGPGHRSAARALSEEMRALPGPDGLARRLTELAGA